jgi:hopanoid-associated phosphorylase
MPPARIFAVTGLAREARVLRGGAVRVFVGGGDGLRLFECLDRAAGEGACAILSVGIAGGLKPGLSPGTPVIASSVAAFGNRLETTGPWADALSRAIPHAAVGPVAGEDRIVGSVDEKACLYRACGALAVDMESHIAGTIAHAHRIPFAALRIVADPAERSLPSAAKLALNADGSVSMGRILRELAREPAQVKLLLRTAIDAGAALRVLAQCCRLAGPCFGISDIGELLLDVS